MLHLSRHDRPSHAFPAESFDELGKFSQRKPVHGRTAGFDLRGSFLFDRGDHNVVALRAGSIEDEEWEASVARDDAEFGGWSQLGIITNLFGYAGADLDR